MWGNEKQIEEPRDLHIAVIGGTRDTFRAFARDLKKAYPFTRHSLSNPFNKVYENHFTHKIVYTHYLYDELPYKVMGARFDQVVVINNWSYESLGFKEEDMLKALIPCLYNSLLPEEYQIIYYH